MAPLTHTVTVLFFKFKMIIFERDVEFSDMSGASDAFSFVYLDLISMHHNIDLDLQHNIRRFHFWILSLSLSLFISMYFHFLTWKRKKYFFYCNSSLRCIIDRIEYLHVWNMCTVIPKSTIFLKYSLKIFCNKIWKLTLHTCPVFVPPLPLPWWKIDFRIWKSQSK